MDPNVDDIEYNAITKMLHELPKVKAPDNFETQLWRRINSETYQFKYQNEKWWEKFLTPARLIPSLGLGLAAIIILFVLNLSGTDSENPLVAAPKVRNDMVTTTPQVMLQQELSNNSLSSSSFSASINKSGYNFLQVRLSGMEKERIERLRSRIYNYFNKDNK